MSGKRWTQARRALRPTQEQIDREKRAMARPPLWRRLLRPIAPGLIESWWKRWEREHRKKLKKAMKRVSHRVKGA